MKINNLLGALTDTPAKRKALLCTTCGVCYLDCSRVCVVTFVNTWKHWIQYNALESISWASKDDSQVVLGVANVHVDAVVLYKDTSCYDLSGLVN